MEFRLSDDQLELQHAVRKFCVDTLPIGGVAERTAGLGDRSSWRALADLGVFGLLVPVEKSGSGLGCLEAAVVFEQLGGHLVEGPVLWSTMTAPLVTGAEDGSRVVAGLEADLQSGDPVVVEHGSQADTIVVLCHGGAFSHERADLPDPSRSSRSTPSPRSPVLGGYPKAPGSATVRPPSTFVCSEGCSAQPNFSGLPANPSKWRATTR